MRMATTRVRKVLRYSVHDLSELTGVSLHTIRKDAQSGRIDKQDLESLVLYVMERSSRLRKRLAPLILSDLQLLMKEVK